MELTGKLAAAVGASVTLLHVMAEPPAIYADLVRLEEDVDRLLRSGSELGRNLLAQKQSLEKLGILVEVRVRHGFVIDQIFADVSERGHDLIVTGSSPTRGPLGHYIMGDLTRGIVNRANVPVLVARSAKGRRRAGRNVEHVEAALRLELGEALLVLFAVPFFEQRILPAHQRFPDQDRVHSARLDPRQIFRGPDSAFADEHDLGRNFFAQRFGHA